MTSARTGMVLPSNGSLGYPERMSMFDQEDLAELRYAWGDAYVINGGNGAWSATRTDNGASLAATTAESLLEKIREDYAASPVPRPAWPSEALGNIPRKFGG